MFGGLSIQRAGCRKDIRARIRKRLRSPGINSMESIPPVYVASQNDIKGNGTGPLSYVIGSLESVPRLLKRLQIRAQKVHSIWHGAILNKTRDEAAQGTLKTLFSSHKYIIAIPVQFYVAQLTLKRKHCSKDIAHRDFISKVQQKMV